MKSHSIFSIVACFVLAFLVPAAASMAQDKASDEKTESTSEKPSVEINKIETSDDKHADNGNNEEQATLEGQRIDAAVTIGEQKIAYHAAVKSIEITKDDGKTKATLYFTEYIRTYGDEEEKPRQRPITFCFNGGPGSASVWLHLGGLSPKRITYQPSELKPKSFELEDNPDSLLAVTDLVFIDPVQTGYSRPLKEDEKAKFLGVENDIESIGEFIRLYLTRHSRWKSPLYLLGESYGGIRGTGLVNYLWDRHYIAAAGLVLVSPVVDFQTISSAPGNDLPYVMFFPSMAATAFYHGKADPEFGKDLNKVLDHAEDFALNRYSVALLKGQQLPKKQQRRLAEAMSGMLGIDAEYILRANLRVGPSEFRKELLRDKGLVLGRYDGRFKGPDANLNGTYPSFDPSGSYISEAFATSMRHYLADTFHVKQESSYEILSSKVRPWDYDASNRYADTSDRLKSTMLELTNLRVFIAAGYMDLATPYMGIEHTINHLQLPADYRDRIDYGYYPAGHMMYIDQDSQKELTKDLTKFYRP